MELNKLIKKGHTASEQEVRPCLVKSTKSNTGAQKASTESRRTSHGKEDNVCMCQYNTGKDKNHAKKPNKKISELGWLKWNGYKHLPQMWTRQSQKHSKSKNCVDQIPPQAKGGEAKLPPRPSRDKMPTKMTNINNKRMTIPELYAGICVLQEPGSICPLNKDSCKDSISVEQSAKKMYPLHCVQEKGDGITLFEKDSCR